MFGSRFICILSPCSRDAMHRVDYAAVATCLSVCLSHAGILLKWLGYHQIYFTIGSPHHSSFSLQYSINTLTGVLNDKGVVALLSERGRAMLRVCQQLAPVVWERNILLLITSASDLLLRTIIKFCSIRRGRPCWL